MEIIQIFATNLPDAWYQSLYAIVDHGRKFKIDQGSYAGQQRLELDFFVVHIKKPGMIPLLPSMPESSPIPPPVDENYLNDYLPYLMTGKVKNGESYTYGQRICKAEIGFYFNRKLHKDPNDCIFENGFLNQLETMIFTYKNKGHRNNQMILQIAQPTDMTLKDPPCLRHIDTRIQDNKLHFFPYFRSWDLFGGFSANLAAIELMKQYCADSIGVENGEIIASSKGLHLYDHIWPIVEMLRGKSI